MYFMLKRRNFLLKCLNAAHVHLVIRCRLRLLNISCQLSCVSVSGQYHRVLLPFTVRKAILFQYKEFTGPTVAASTENISNFTKHSCTKMKSHTNLQGYQHVVKGMETAPIQVDCENHGIFQVVKNETFVISNNMLWTR